MAEEEIVRKLLDIQARLGALSSAIEDHTTRIITLEETVAGLLIPRVLQRRILTSSSMYEYRIYAEPLVGTPLTVEVKAETHKEAITKAEKMFSTQLVKSEILSKTPLKSSRSKLSSRWVLELYPDEIPVWLDFIHILEARPLTEREQSFMRSLDYYVRTERKITIPMISWLYAIARKYEVAMPEVPYPRR